MGRVRVRGAAPETAEREALGELGQGRNLAGAGLRRAGELCRVGDDRLGRDASPAQRAEGLGSAACREALPGGSDDDRAVREHRLRSA